MFFYKPISFQLLLQQTTTNVVTWNNTNLLSYSSGGERTKISLPGLKSRCRQGCILLYRLQERIRFFAFSSFQGLPPTFLLALFRLQIQQCQAGFLLCCHVSGSFFCLLLLPIRTLVITLGPPRWSRMLSSSQSKPISKQFHLQPWFSFSRFPNILYCLGISGTEQNPVTSPSTKASSCLLSLVYRKAEVSQAYRSHKGAASSS